MTSRQWVIILKWMRDGSLSKGLERHPIAGDVRQILRLDADADGAVNYSLIWLRRLKICAAREYECQADSENEHRAFHGKNSYFFPAVGDGPLPAFAAAQRFFIESASFFRPASDRPPFFFASGFAGAEALVPLAFAQRNF